MTGLRFSMPLIAAALLAGCQHGPGGTIDPFGRTTIPPPPTGSASIHSKSKQYYGNNPRPMVPVAAKPGNATASTTPQTPQTPQEGAQAANWVSNTPTTANPQNRLQPIPPYETEPSSVKPPPNATPPAASTATASTTTAPPPHVAPAKVTSPPAGAQPPTPAVPHATPIDPTAPLQWSRGNPAPTVAPTVATTPATGQNVTVRREPVHHNPPRMARYGHAKDYTSLRGQLEYAASNRVWKIRYIPIHGQQDAYGGQFVLTDRSKLEAFQAGDYVTIEGAIVAANAATDNTGSGPLYAPHRVAPLAP